MSASTNQQVKALIWRYWITAIRWPVSTAIRLLVWPGLLIGLIVGLIWIMIKTDSNNPGSLKRAIVPLVSSVIMPLITVFQVYHYTKWIVGDRDSGMKSLMLSTGVRRISFYLCDCFCFLAGILPSVLILGAISIIYLFEDSKSSPVAILTVFLLFAMHLTGLMFAISSLFTRSKYVASVIILLLWEGAFQFVVVSFAKACSNSSLPIVLFMASISPYQSMRLLFSSYAVCKNCDEAQLTDENAFSQPTNLLIIAMSCWTVATFAFARWFEEVSPWQRDSAIKSPLFCLKSSSSGSSEKDYSIELVGGLEASIDQAKYFESVSEVNRKVGIRIQKVRKLYKSKAAVDDLSLDIYRGETTLLLGHNGAGKTTLMDIILGRISHDSGHVRINESSLGQTSVGLCPQNSILDENLTVRQHLELFYALKSPATSDAKRAHHIDETLRDVYLTENAHKLPGQLSGGMQRKLSLGMAFVGHSSVLVLDEPSSGMDPESRQSIWTTIRKYRADKTVLLSTQHMEEADYLGDRVAIMNAGKIVSCGSSMFLNNIFGSGYKLRVECKVSDAEQVLQLVKKHFLGAHLHEDLLGIEQLGRSSLDLVIELNADPSSEYECKLIELLEDLEQQSAHENSIIRSFGIKSSSLDDVLLKTKTLFESKKQEDNSARVTILPASENVDNFTRANSGDDERFSFLTQQESFLKALLIKNLMVCRNDLTQSILRILLTLVGCWCTIHYLENSMTGSSIVESYPIVALVYYLVYYPTIENVSKFKVMQFGSNLHFVTYWLAQLLSDLILIGFQVVMVNILLTTSFEGQLVASGSEIRVILSAAIILFGIASCLLAYIFSTMFTNANSSVGLFTLFLMLNGVICLFLPVIGLIISHDMRGIMNVVDHVFAAAVPLPALTRVVSGLATQCYIKEISDPNCQPSDCVVSPVAYGLLALLLQIVVYTAILYLIESRRVNVISWLKAKLRRTQLLEQEHESEHIDEDVLDESRKVLHLFEEPQLAQTTHSLLAVDLSKSHTPGVKAVDHLSFGAKKGECFGLLGVNGAGKTTTFSMIAREFLPDSGCIWTGPMEDLGYDPQCNPEMLLTVEQALYLMARLRRVAERNIAALVRGAIDILELTEHSHKVARSLSGGSKRKLYLAMSLIGHTSLLVLDEPTAGVDPMARRNVWLLLKSLRRNNQASIVVSSHVMEECEAICDRMAIMARGKLRCVGTLLHLRSKFSQSCTVKIQFVGCTAGNGDSSKDILVDQIKDRLETELNTSSLTLIDSNFNSATLKISEGNIRRSILFKALREFKQANQQVRYQVNDASFEDIFLAIAREQEAANAKTVSL